MEYKIKAIDSENHILTAINEDGTIKLQIIFAVELDKGKIPNKKISYVHLMDRQIVLCKSNKVDEYIIPCGVYMLNCNICK